MAVLTSSPSSFQQILLLSPLQAANILILVSYLASILGLLGLILATLPRPSPSTPGGQHGRLLARIVFALGTVASGAHTWYYMIRFLQHSYTTYTTAHPPLPTTPPLLTFATWLEHTSLFNEAWRHVCSTPANWWWSEHICLYTISWTAFVYIEGRRHSIRHLWAYALLGQLMAISTASSLFFLALFSSPVRDPPVPRQRLSLQVYLPILAAVFPVLYTPLLKGEAFLPNLLLLHGLLLIPFLPVDKLLAFSGLPLPSSSGTLDASTTLLPPSTLLTLLELLTCATRAITIRSLPSGSAGIWRDGKLLWETLLTHPAQSSIGCDALHCSVLLLLYSLLRRGAWPSLPGLYESGTALLGLLAAGPGVVAPLVFRGGVRERKKTPGGKGKGKSGKYGELLKPEEKEAEGPRRTRSGRLYSDMVKS